MHMKCNTPSCNLVAQYIKSAASATILHVKALWFQVTLQTLLYKCVNCRLRSLPVDTGVSGSASLLKLVLCNRWEST